MIRKQKVKISKSATNDFKFSHITETSKTNIRKKKKIVIDFHRFWAKYKMLKLWICNVPIQTRHVLAQNRHFCRQRFIIAYEFNVQQND